MGVVPRVDGDAMKPGRFLWAAIGMLMLSTGFSLAILFLVGARKPPLAKWDGSRWSCPPGWQVVADEREAAAGRDSAHCSR